VTWKPAMSLSSELVMAFEEVHHNIELMLSASSLRSLRLCARKRRKGSASAEEGGAACMVQLAWVVLDDYAEDDDYMFAAVFCNTAVGAYGEWPDTQKSQC